MAMKTKRTRLKRGKDEQSESDKGKGEKDSIEDK